MTRPPLSVVIPTYNSAALTLAACRAVIDTAPPGTELIVVDDASSDDTAATLAAAVPSARLLRLDRNRRFAGAVNEGLTLAASDLLLVLNSDTRVEPGALAALIAAFAGDERLGVAGAQLLNEDMTPQWSGGRFPTLAWLAVLAGGTARLRRRRATPHSGSIPIDWVSGASMAFRRAVWDSVGPFREHYRFYAQDLDFCDRAAAAGWRITIESEARVLHLGGVTVKKWRQLDALAPALAHDPSLLWLDLLTWARERRGPLWAFMARLLMIGAASLRLLLRSMALPFERDRRMARSATAVYARALRQLVVERK